MRPLERSPNPPLLSVLTRTFDGFKPRLLFILNTLCFPSQDSAVPTQLHPKSSRFHTSAPSTTLFDPPPTHPLAHNVSPTSLPGWHPAPLRNRQVTILCSSLELLHVHLRSALDDSRMHILQNQNLSRLYLQGILAGMYVEF